MDYLLTSYARRINGPFLRFSLAIILAWIGALKLVDPSPVVGLLRASLPFLAFNGFVYVLGSIELVVAILLVTGFPTLSLAGQFLLKDLGLMTAAVNVIAMAPVRDTRRLATRAVAA